ncbi:DUF2804 family protein [Mesorhizobium xinjiangense]|uniref:DUF2804 family protein n=1 Tax=Mesorhizobium xinjiangense TaxID=2678685 RepID=UPI0012EE58CD|nr:DUF2804 family protein [Mesorhizobium xinjiangense]
MEADAGLIKRLRRAMLARAGEANLPGPPRQPAPLRSGEAITARDDGFHFQDFQHHSHKLFYVEWWYYNFQDPVSGLSGMVTFAVSNPGNELDLGTASLNMAVFQPGKEVVTDIEFFHITHFAAAPECADVTIASNTVKVVDPDTYRVRARTGDGAVSMDLTFHRKGPSQLLANNVPGYSDWEVSSWLVYMPGAQVEGSVVVDGQTYGLSDAKGYHDHDWGMWMLPERIWSWAQFSTPDHTVAFDVGFHAAFQKSTAYLRWGDKALYFPQDRFKATQSDWQSWWHFWDYPTRVSFEGVDAGGEYILRLEWQVAETSTLWKYPLIVFEQACNFTGQLLARESETGKAGAVLAEISTPGFCEYTDRWIGGHRDE